MRILLMDSKAVYSFQKNYFIDNRILAGFNDPATAPIADSEAIV